MHGGVRGRENLLFFPPTRLWGVSRRREIGYNEQKAHNWERILI